jgi:chloramphenicol-sensitive protein RarD
MAYGVGAYLLWGLLPLYWPLLEPAGAVEILAHRIAWSLVVVVGVLVVRNRWGFLRPLLADRRAVLGLTVAALLIGANWLVYIWAVNAEHVVETSLGYFINPIVSVLMGVTLLGERLRSLQWVAVGIGVVAVGVLTAAYGRLPWIALTLALTFAIYGLVKKQVGGRVAAAESLAFETVVLILPAVAVIGWLEVSGRAEFGHAGAGNALLLAAAGPITVVPLLFFAGAARRIPLSALGLLQYLAPVMQFAIGVAIRQEAMPASRWVGFGLVWSALVLLGVEGLAVRRRRGRVQARLAEPEPEPAAA